MVIVSKNIFPLLKGEERTTEKKFFAFFGAGKKKAIIQNIQEIFIFIPPLDVYLK